MSSIFKCNRHASSSEEGWKSVKVQLYMHGMKPRMAAYKAVVVTFFSLESIFVEVKDLSKF